MTRADAKRLVELFDQHQQYIDRLRHLEEFVKSGQMIDKIRIEFGHGVDWHEIPIAALREAESKKLSQVVGEIQDLGGEIES